MKRILWNLARATGWYLMPRWRLEQWDLISHLAALFENYGIDAVLDVGANKGQYGNILRREVGFKGWILSFEPVAANIEALKARAAEDPRWVIHDYALGREKTKLPLHVTNDSVFSSFLNPLSGVVPGYDASASVEHNEMIDVRPLAEIWPELQSEYGIRRPYIKIDTQGYDLEVIAGAGKAMSAMVAMQTEVSLRAIYEGAPDMQASFKALREIGFDPTGFFPVLRDSACRLVELDCTAVNRSFVQA